MSVVQLHDEVQLLIERQVAGGRAVSSTVFVEEAVLRLVDESGAEDDAIQRVVGAGLADIDAGRFTTVETREDELRLRDRLLERVQARLAADG